MEKKSYYAIIPASVRYDEKLTANAKLLYGEITALCNEKGYCWAGDKYFCDLYKVNRTTVQRWFKTLEQQGYIRREVKYKEGTREIEYRYTYLCDKGTRKNETTPIRKNETDNNTSFNNTNNNTYNKKTIVPKSKYGEFKNVLLTDDEYKKLTERFSTDYKERIERLSGYVASTGKSYKSHYATIINWAKKDSPVQTKKQADTSWQQQIGEL